MRTLKTILLVALFIMSVSAGIAHAKKPYNEPRDVVKAERFAKPKTPPFVIPKQQPRIQPQVLPLTGAEVTGYLVLGLAAVGGGLLIVRRTRSVNS